jgi:hypothetical protein
MRAYQLSKGGAGIEGLVQVAGVILVSATRPARSHSTLYNCS